ncbi:hypothetical protein AJ79_02602 [Helicocarpus griseus UAMH5409]|uniref:Beta-xylosidase C-terminal Concanavalin A-like domain-containing protein n=1 Tax=Helicocarpus griseus UAMH5409 TaxID=1447875 RepID=A0A2B7Y3G9_9EURO|nr:hypothetical protein AJ79_02602 [Helicocarpus griseus UAMH5409]
MRLHTAIYTALLSLPLRGVLAGNSTFSNPLIPGWSSDPSCVYVRDGHDAYFCVASTFGAFPGIPIYGSRDLVNWKLVSHAFSRPSQVPWINIAEGQQDGIFAVTLRYHEGLFHAITTYTNPFTQGLIFTTEDPYSDSWSEPILFNTTKIDPDLFWDDDGQVYLTSMGVIQQTIDLATGAVSEPYDLWPGTGGVWPEGPHIYKKDGYYYLMIAEGGTEMDHSVTIARSKNIKGPYESYSGNPILTNRGTDEYFQTVGHADLFQDASGQWWGSALATRCGPDYEIYPMGRETVFFPVTWEEGEWPILQPVRGRMEGWELPKHNKRIGGTGAFVNEPDVIDFHPGSSLPAHFVHWRFIKPEDFVVSPRERPHTLRLTASRGNLTASPPEIPYTDPMTLVMRRQTASLFTFSADVSFDPDQLEHESGLTLFLTQMQHADLSIVGLPSKNGKIAPHIRFRVMVQREFYDGVIPETVVKPIPPSWRGRPIRFQIQAANLTHFTFSASSTKRHDGKAEIFGVASAEIFSGSPGHFTGTLVGVYATTNGGNASANSYISRWRYKEDGQYIGDDAFVPYTPFIFE